MPCRWPWTPACAEVTLSRLGRGGRVDHPPDLGDLVGREAASPGVLLNDRLVLCEVDAKGLVVGDVALDPLDIGTELFEGRVRLLRGLSQGLPLGAADRRQFAFDDELAHGSSFGDGESYQTELSTGGKARHHLFCEEPHRGLRR